MAWQNDEDSFEPADPNRDKLEAYYERQKLAAMLGPGATVVHDAKAGAFVAQVWRDAVVSQQDGMAPL